MKSSPPAESGPAHVRSPCDPGRGHISASTDRIPVSVATTACGLDFLGRSQFSAPLGVGSRPSQVAESDLPRPIRLPLTELGEYMQFGLDARRKPGTSATAVCDQFSQQ